MKVVKEGPKEDNTFLDFAIKGPVIRDTRRGPAFSDPEIAGDFASKDQKRQTLGQMTFEERNMGQSVTQKLLQNRRLQRDSDQIIDKINLFTGEGIGIFDKDMKESKDSPKMYIWDRLEADELQYVIAQPPKNAIEEMIQWTEEGKLWRYPINNEQGMDGTDIPSIFIDFIEILKLL